MEPSQFWAELGAEHSRDLATYGVEACKRHQALRYFTWRWNWSSVRSSEQMRFLLKHTSVPTLIRTAFTPARLAGGDWEGIPWPKRDRWLYTFANRLLWQYAAGRDTLGVTKLREPELGRPIPVKWRKRLISQDLANGALEAAAIGRALRGTQPESIIELGAGYGRTAYVLMNLFARAQYTIVDIEPARTISRWYLSQLVPPERLRFVAPEEVDTIEAGSIDLAVTISSLQEMTPKQVGGYLELFDRVAAGGAVYLKQWETWHNPTDDVTMNIDDYPIPDRWVPLFREHAPVQTRFIQAGWHIPEPA